METVLAFFIFDIALLIITQITENLRQHSFQFISI